MIRRKLRRPRTGQTIVAEAAKYVDPSHDSDKAQNPLNFHRASYATAFCSQPLWATTSLTARHITQLFGEPSRICNSHVEYVLRIPSREILKIIVESSNVSIHGFNRTPTVERWVERLMAS